MANSMRYCQLLCKLHYLVPCTKRNFHAIVDFQRYSSQVLQDKCWIGAISAFSALPRSASPLQNVSVAFHCTAGSSKNLMFKVLLLPLYSFRSVVDDF
mmetsp:Transcript_6041/g.10039  ORF Transcript_6041/g.10039 Transcript_6041/m.10039 type:complete len:98 (-) Transcript_6041:1851-2144(-)